MQDSVMEERIEVSRDAAEEARLGISRHAPTERFIPVSQFELFQRLTRTTVWPEQSVPAVKALFRFMVKWRQLKYAERQQDVLRNYHAFNPDTDTASFETLSAGERMDRQRAFIGQVRELLERANYDEIALGTIDAVLSEQNPYGLEFHVDLDEFEELHIFYRGQSETTARPSLVERYVMRKKPVTLPIYQRLVVILKLKPVEVRVRELMDKDNIDIRRAEKLVHKLRKTLPKAVIGDHIYLKMFKFIPRADLEMLFPNTRLKIRKMDKLQLGLTAGGGTTAGLVTTATKLATVAALTNPITVGVAVVGLCGVLYRQVSQIFNKRTQYMATLSQNLYFHNLANNGGVLSVLAERALEEDVKEEFLLYTILAKAPVRRAQLGDVKAAVESYLLSELNVRLNFDVEDALRRLIADGIVQELPDTTLFALPPKHAAEHIDHMWDAHLDDVARDENAPIHATAG
jgi:hypothetical protein